jgi:hypothetical protein
MKASFVSVFAFCTVANAVDLVTFDDASNWKTLIDPVMGGQSVATASVTDGHGILDGEVKIVPKLQAPGFITAQADVKTDASEAYGGDFVMKVRSTTPDYTGFKVSFAASTTFATLACASGGSTALGRGCFKAPFSVAAGDDFSEIRIPLSEFSDKWSSATGELTTLCKDDPSVCPTAEKLKKVQLVSIWGEGAAGKVHVELDSISIESPSGKRVHLAGGNTVALATFDGLDDASSRKWVQQNDPVMGGKSTGTFTVQDSVGIMNGTCALIPSLNAPGFIKTSTVDVLKKFPDASSCAGLALTVRSTSTPANFPGYRVSFGSDSAFKSCGKFFARGFKADFAAPEGDFGTVKVPFNMFTTCWDDATGDAIKTCSDHPEFCPPASRLANLQSLSVWAEGHEGDVKLEIQSIAAYDCASSIVV